MKDYQYYVSHLNFKEYESTNAFAYELMMRNEECQQCFKLLHRVVNKLVQRSKYFTNYIEKKYKSDPDLKQYIKQKLDLDTMTQRVQYIEIDFLKNLSNVFFLLKAASIKEEWVSLVLDYIKNKESWKRYPYLLSFLENINYVDERKLDLMIAKVGQISLVQKFPDLFLFNSIPKTQHDMSFGTFGFELDSIMQKLKRDKEQDLEELYKIEKKFIIPELEEIYRDYKKVKKEIVRLHNLRKKIEAFITKEFYVNFSNDLYLDYDFFSQKLQKELYKFYRGEASPIFKKQKEQFGLDAEIIKDGEVVYNGVKLKTKEIFSLDSEVFEQLDSIYAEESLKKIISKDTSAYVFRYTMVEPVFDRPTLFSERFRDINLNFNPNLGKNELLSQFKAIIDAYQSNALQTKSIYEILGEEFKKWDKYIHRKKNSNSRQKTEIDSKQISTLVKNCQDILYVYDANKNGMDFKTIAYATKLGEGTISSYLNFAKFLIEEKGFRFLLTTTP